MYSCVMRTCILITTANKDLVTKYLPQIKCILGQNHMLVSSDSYSHFFLLCPISTVRNVENNYIQIEKNNFFGSRSSRILVFSSHVLITLFCIFLRSCDRNECFKRFKTLMSVRRTRKTASNNVT